jgi:7,8-dihydroneopterin aldolase/epimerase/oxygenase
VKDRVHGTGFSYDCRIGFHEYERHIRQRVVVDFEVETDWREIARADRARKLVDYYEINLVLQQLVDLSEWRLIEAMAEDIACLICLRFPIDRVRVKVTKAPFDMPNTGSVAVECWRSPDDFAGRTDPIEERRLQRGGSS